MEKRKALLKLTRSEIFVIDPAVETPALEALHLIHDLAPFPVSYHLPAIVGFESIEKRSKSVNIRGIIILGSLSNVGDKLPWQDQLIKWLKEPLERSVPTLGICFGHQLLAHMHGAPVGKYKPGIKLRGLRTVTVHGDSRLGIQPSQGELAVSHEEYVRSLPRGFKLLASSAEIGIDAIAHEKLPIWGWQPHIEARESFCEGMSLDPQSLPARLEFGNRLLKSFCDFLKVQE
ncbi:MAG: hypothetical protein KA436_12640 [Oligoflexales bacterium]|nr:hypothetical protein [Oligoflexales bacterium]